MIHISRRLQAAAFVALAVLATSCASSDSAGQTVGVESGSEAGSEAASTAESGPDGLSIFDDPEAVRATLDASVFGSTSQWPTDWTRTTVDVSEIRAGLRGADPRDGIPPIDFPEYESVEAAAEWLSGNQPGAVVQVNGQAWFYPLAIMTAHEIVNDTLADVPVAVTYCPLCNTALAFDRRVDGQVLRFGVSGLLRKSDLVMWDDQTTSLWQQVTGEGIVGTYAGTNLTPISTAIVSFAQFAENFPSGQSLSRETGFGRTYGSNPYEKYSSSNSPIGSFFLGDPDPRLPALSRVVGVTTPTTAQAYPFEVLATQRVVNDTIDDIPIVVLWGGDTADALDLRSIQDSAAIGTAIAFRAEVEGQALTFEVNGDGFRDRETGSEWNVLGLATAGELEGTRLETVTHRNEFWFAFAGFFPAAIIHMG